jgi:hypothetical protein
MRRFRIPKIEEKKRQVDLFQSRTLHVYAIIYRLLRTARPRVEIHCFNKMTGKDTVVSLSKDDIEIILEEMEKLEALR